MIGILIFILLFLVITSLIIWFILNNTNKNNTILSELNGNCKTSKDCGNSLTCVNSICLGQNGYITENKEDCASKYISAGACADNPDCGGTGQKQCDKGCNENLILINGYCLLKPGYTTTDYKNCASGFLSNGKCSDYSQLGNFCSTDGTTSNCDPTRSTCLKYDNGDSYCQLLNITSWGGDGSYCNDNLKCTQGSCNYNTNTCGPMTEANFMEHFTNNYSGCSTPGQSKYSGKSYCTYDTTVQDDGTVNPIYGRKVSSNAGTNSVDIPGYYYVDKVMFDNGRQKIKGSGFINRIDMGINQNPCSAYRNFHPDFQDRGYIGQNVAVLKDGVLLDILECLPNTSKDGAFGGPIFKFDGSKWVIVDGINFIGASKSMPLNFRGYKNDDGKIYMFVEYGNAIFASGLSLTYNGGGDKYNFFTNPPYVEQIMPPDSTNNPIDFLNFPIYTRAGSVDFIAYDSNGRTSYYLAYVYNKSDTTVGYLDVNLNQQLVVFEDYKNNIQLPDFKLDDTWIGRVTCIKYYNNKSCYNFAILGIKTGIPVILVFGPGPKVIHLGDTTIVIPQILFALNLPGIDNSVNDAFGSLSYFNATFAIDYTEASDNSQERYKICVVSNLTITDPNSSNKVTGDTCKKILYWDSYANLNDTNELDTSNIDGQNYVSKPIWQMLPGDFVSHCMVNYIDHELYAYNPQKIITYYDTTITFDGKNPDLNTPFTITNIEKELRIKSSTSIPLNSSTENSGKTVTLIYLSILISSKDNTTVSIKVYNEPGATYTATTNKPLFIFFPTNLYITQENIISLGISSTLNINSTFKINMYTYT